MDVWLEDEQQYKEIWDADWYEEAVRVKAIAEPGKLKKVKAGTYWFFTGEHLYRIRRVNETNDVEVAGEWLVIDEYGGTGAIELRLKDCVAWIRNYGEWPELSNRNE